MPLTKDVIDTFVRRMQEPYTAALIEALDASISNLDANDQEQLMSESRDAAKRSPLAITCCLGNEGLVQWLLQHHASLLVKTDGYYPIHHAIISLHPSIGILMSITSALWKLQPSQRDAMVDDDGAGPLCYSSTLRNKDLRYIFTDKLLETRDIEGKLVTLFNPNIGEGETKPLLAAILVDKGSRDDNVIQLLLDRGADVSCSAAGLPNSFLAAVSVNYIAAAQMIINKDLSSIGCLLGSEGNEATDLYKVAESWLKDQGIYDADSAKIEQVDEDVDLGAAAGSSNIAYMGDGPEYGSDSDLE